MEYSYFIKRNIKFFNNNGYTLYPNGSQVYKRIGDYDVLITDYTGKKLSLGKCIRELVFCPKMEKIDKEIAKIIEEF